MQFAPKTHWKLELCFVQKREKVDIAGWVPDAASYYAHTAVLQQHDPTVTKAWQRCLGNKRLTTHSIH